MFQDLNMTAMGLRIRAEVDPNVLRKAQIIESPKINKNYSVGKKKGMETPVMRACCRNIV